MLCFAHSHMASWDTPDAYWPFLTSGVSPTPICILNDYDSWQPVEDLQDHPFIIKFVRSFNSAALNSGKKNMLRWPWKLHSESSHIIIIINTVIIMIMIMIIIITLIAICKFWVHIGGTKLGEFSGARYVYFLTELAAALATADRSSRRAHDKSVDPWCIFMSKDHPSCLEYLLLNH